MEIMKVLTQNVATKKYKVQFVPSSWSNDEIAQQANAIGHKPIINLANSVIEKNYDVANLTKSASHFGIIPAGNNNITLYAVDSFNGDLYKYTISNLENVLDAYGIIEDDFQGWCMIFDDAKLNNEVMNKGLEELLKYIKFTALCDDKKLNEGFKKRYPNDYTDMIKYFNS